MKILILLPILFLAVIWDFYKGKVPNYLIAAGLLTGIVNLICHHNLESILIHIPGMIFPIILLFPLYKIGTLGAGDIKLFSMLGIYFSFMETVFCIFSAFCIGAVIAFLILIWRRNLKERLFHFIYYIKDFFSTGYFKYYYAENDYENAKSQMHFSLPIFLSVLFYVCR